MKGIILAGGNGQRLNPLTDVTNKHLLPIYNKPMIFYPLQTLLDAGIKDIFIVTGREHAGSFLKLLRSGKDFGCRFSYEIQEEAGGIAQALALAENFVGDDNCMVILGDNIFEDNFSKYVKDFENSKNGARNGILRGARIFLKSVKDPGRFGVAELKDGKVVNIVEKPAKPASSYAVTGLYIYDKRVFDIIRTLKPSRRGELEITDVSNHYVREGLLKGHFVKGEWTDSGTFESLFRANQVARELYLKNKPDAFKMNKSFKSRT